MTSEQIRDYLYAVIDAEKRHDILEHIKQYRQEELIRNKRLKQNKKAKPPHCAVY